MEQCSEYHTENLLSLTFLILVAVDPSPSHLHLGHKKEGLRSYVLLWCNLWEVATHHACVCGVCVCVCQAVLICMELLARHAFLNGQKTKKQETERPLMYCTDRLPATIRTTVTMETQHWLSLEGDNKPHIGGESSFAPWQQGW